MTPKLEPGRKLNPHYVMRWWMMSLPAQTPAELRLTVHALFAYSNDWFTKAQLTNDVSFTSSCSHSQVAGYVGKSISTVKRYLAELRQQCGLLTWVEASSKNEGNIFTVYASPQEFVKNHGVSPGKVEQARKAAQVRWEKAGQLKSDAAGQLKSDAEVSSDALPRSAHLNAGSAQVDAGSAQQVSYSGFSGSSGNTLGKTTVETTTVNVSQVLPVEQNEQIQPTADFCPESKYTEHIAGSDGVCALCGFDNPAACADPVRRILRQFSKFAGTPFATLVGSEENHRLAESLLRASTTNEILAVMSSVMTTGYWADKINTFRFFVDKFPEKLVPAHVANERGRKARETAAGKTEGKLALEYNKNASDFLTKKIQQQKEKSNG